MFAGRRSRWILVSLVLLGVAGVAVVGGVQYGPAVVSQLTGADGSLFSGGNPDLTGADAVTGDVVAEATATPSPRGGRQIVTARRGPISELLGLSGRVAGVDEVALSFPTLARVETVSVTPGQVVEGGQVLLEAESKEIARQLDAARARVDVSTIRLSQAEAQAQARQRDAERQADAERVRLQLAVTGAESTLRRAQADYERVKAGAPPAERQAAANAVRSAQTTLDRAKAELGRASQGPSDTDLKAADERVWSARIAQQRAEEALERLRQGADPTDTRAAERDVAAAQTTVDRAVADLERLVSGPDPQARTSAQRDIQRAELALRVATATKAPKDKAGALAHDAAIRNAQLSLQDAREHAARLNTGPAAWEVEAARRAVTSARMGLDAANERLATVRQGPDSLTLASANQAAQEARMATQAAEARYLELAAGPPPDRVDAAQQTVENAQAALVAAVAHQADVNSHPTRDELQEVQERLTAAQAAADQARSDAEQSTQPPADDDETDPASYDLLVLRKGVEQDRAAVASLERDLIATRMTAPFAGTIASVQVRPGDPLEPGRTAVTLAKPGTPIIQIDLADTERARMSSGQTAVIQIAGPAGGQFDATVTAVVAPEGGTPFARLDVNWPATVPVLGTTADVAVKLQQKEDVVLIPQRAIRSTGQRRFVEIVDGQNRRNVDVQVGIVQGGDAEIVSGVSAGQLVTVDAQGG